MSADSLSLPWQQLLGVRLPILSLLSLSVSLWRAGSGHQQKCRSDRPQPASQFSNRDPDAVAGLRLLGLGLLHPHLSAEVVLAARENLSCIEATCALSFKSQCPKRWQKTVTLCRTDLSAPWTFVPVGLGRPHTN